MSGSRADAVQSPSGAANEASVEESAAPEVGEFEIPRPDPLYEEGSAELTHVSPAEFLNHAFPAEPRYIDPQIKER
ncbi:MAG: hypothetical protein ACC652_00235 [Acidimicrobiales bacterium]